MSENINVGKLSEALNNKVDRNLRNTDTGSGADAVVEYQIPTAENNYTWYRKYASGWVEQGQTYYNPTAVKTVVTFPVPMMGEYSVQITQITSDSSAVYFQVATYDKTDTTMGVLTRLGSSGNRTPVSWEVKGMSASL